MKTFRVTLVLLGVLLAWVVSAQEEGSSDLERVLQIRERTETKLRETYKKASFALTPDLILELAGDRLDAVYVHLGEQIRFGTTDIRMQKTTITATSTEGRVHDAFWAEKLADRAWIHFQFKDGSYVIVATQLGRLEIADYKQKTELVRRELVAPYVSEGFQEEGISYTKFDDNFLRLKEPAKNLTSGVQDAPLHPLGAYHSKGKRTSGYVTSLRLGLHPSPFYPAKEIDAYRPARSR